MHRLARRKLERRCGVLGKLMMSVLAGNYACLLGLAMERVAAKVRVILLFLKTARSIEALLVAGRGVAGYGFPFSKRFGALQGNDVAWHKSNG